MRGGVGGESFTGCENGYCLTIAASCRAPCDHSDPRGESCGDASAGLLIFFLQKLSFPLMGLGKCAGADRRGPCLSHKGRRLACCANPLI